MKIIILSIVLVSLGSFAQVKRTGPRKPASKNICPGVIFPIEQTPLQDKLGALSGRINQIPDDGIKKIIAAVDPKNISIEKMSSEALRDYIFESLLKIECKERKVNIEYENWAKAFNAP